MQNEIFPSYHHSLQLAVSGHKTNVAVTDIDCPLKWKFISSNGTVGISKYDISPASSTPPLLPVSCHLPFHPSLSSPGFFNRERICCRNSSEGHVNPPWHSWLSRQTDGQASGLTPLSDGPKGNKIYNWPNLPSMTLKSVWQIQGKLTLRVSYLNPKYLKLSSYHTFISYVAINYKTTWIVWCWSGSDVVCFTLKKTAENNQNVVFWSSPA